MHHWTCSALLRYKISDFFSSLLEDGRFRDKSGGVAKLCYFHRMNGRGLTFAGISEALVSSVPEVGELIRTTFNSLYSFEKGNSDENPEAYPVFEDVVKKLVFDQLQTGKNEILLTRLFAFFEEMANSSDLNVSRDLLGIAILEPLVYEKAMIRAAWKFMGPKMKEMAIAEADGQGRHGNLPSP